MSARKIFDCFLFNGEYDVLEIRLHELDSIVDHFIIVTSTLTFDGQPIRDRFNPRDPRIAAFASKFRVLIVTDMPETDDPCVREAWQRNAVLRGVPDAEDNDLIIMSDVDEIPRASVIRNIVSDTGHSIFGFELNDFFFYVDYQNVSGPDSAMTSAVAARYDAICNGSPNSLRHDVRSRTVPACIVPNAGWHFSCLMNRAAVARKITAYSRQESNTPTFFQRLDVEDLVLRRADLFNRQGFVWDVVSPRRLPNWVRRNRTAISQLFAGNEDWITGLVHSLSKTLSRRYASAAMVQRSPPIVICPYLYDGEDKEVLRKFDATGKAKHVEFFLWQDKDRIGPEHSFERCWNLFPGRDVIILHSDMAPHPSDSGTDWYDGLIEHQRRLPDAGMVACNLFYPSRTDDVGAFVQCAGGTLVDGKIGYLNGPVVENGSELGSGVAASLLSEIRAVDWVTFGGVLISRDVINACGGFDQNYKWAYVMDVDYSFEARKRGFRLYQVPVTLTHEESRTTKRLIEVDGMLSQHKVDNMHYFEKKWRPLLSSLLP